MPMPPHNRRASRASLAALGAAGLVALAAAPAAFADETGPSLVVGGIKPIDGMKPGSTFDVPVTVANKGTTTADKVWVTYAVTRGLDYAEVPSNCLTQHIPPYDELQEMWTAMCAFDQPVKPGVVYTTETPLRVKILDRALKDELNLRVGEGDPLADENGSPPVAGTAPALKLVEKQSGGEGAAAPYVAVPVTSVNTADFRVTGAALKGSVGETVPMKVEFTNAGPAWVMTKQGERSVTVVITPPAGTSVVKRGMFCRPEGKAYRCGMIQPALNEGGRQPYTFQLKIDKRVPHAKGSVTLSTEPRPFDPDKTNDKADITLDVTDGGPTGSAGGSAGGPASTGDDGTTTNGGTLAATGSTALPITALAATALVTGAGALAIARRRRTRNLR
ncbi:hypothetical protein GRC12_23415 [Streptomyces griseorubiginosus]|nr:hypothetical protein [Streptomyces griseorubiginosus]